MIHHEIDITISYTPDSGYELDGVSHYDAIVALGSDDDVDDPRDSMLYNMYYNISWYSSSHQEWPTTVQFAVRNSRYKLMNHDNESELTETYAVNEFYGITTGCKQLSSPTNLVLQLYDLWDDPYETNNLYGNSTYSDIQDELWALATTYMESTKEMPAMDVDPSAYSVFDAANSFIVPWDIDSLYFYTSSLQYCENFDSIFVIDD